MTEDAVAKPRSKISRAWLLPILALVIAAWMLYQHQSQQGPLIELALANAEGLEATKTRVRLHNVEVGLVEDIVLSKDRSGVIARIRIGPDYKDLLVEDTRFWVVKVRVDSSGISGIGTLLSGAYIEMLPGSSEQRARQYVVLDKTPITSDGDSGLTLFLNAEHSGQLNEGNAVFYKGFEVGKVQRAEFEMGSDQMRYRLFIREPFNSLVNSNTRFWMTSGLDVELNAGGFKVRTGPLSSLLNSGVEFGLPDETLPGFPVGNEAEFKLFESQDEINQDRYRQHLDYVLLFDESIRGLKAGAPVEYRGVQIGSVVQAPARLKSNGEFLPVVLDQKVPVMIRVDLARLEPDPSFTLRDLHTRLEGLVSDGLRAKLATGSLLTGALYIDLELAPGVPEDFITALHDYRQFPVMPGGRTQFFKDIQTTVDKVAKLDLAGTLAQVNQTLAAIEGAAQQGESLLASRESQQIPKELNQTLASFRRAMAGLEQDGPLYEQLEQSLQSLDEVLQQLKPLSQTLKEQPNAILFNSQLPDDPSPGQEDRP